MLFEDYRKAFSALELQKQAKLFAEDFVAAGPKGVISNTRDAFIRNADKAADFYRRAGQQSAEIKSMKETWCGDKYAMVTVHWAAHFKSLSKPIEFDVSYLVQLTDNKPKIVLFISHEDEEETIKGAWAVGQSGRVVKQDRPQSEEASDVVLVETVWRRWWR